MAVKVQSHQYLRSWSLGSLLVLGMGCLVGACVLGVTSDDPRWVIVLAVIALFGCIVLAMPGRQRFIWVIFILSLQFLDPSVRVLYGYSGSDGLTLTLTFLLGLCVLVVFAVSGRFSHGHPIRWGGPFAWPVALLFCTSAVSLLHGKESFLGISAMLIQIELYLVYFLALNFVRSEEDLHLTLKWLFLMLAGQCLVYYVESALGIYYISPLGEMVTALPGDLTRPGGTISHGPFGFANFVLLIMFVLIAQFMPTRAPGVPRRWYKGILIMMGVVALVLTLSRSAWASFLIGGAWLVFFAYRQRVLSYRKLMYIVLVGVMVAIAAAPLIVLRLEGAPLESSYDERFALMRMAVRVIAENPLFGVGPGAYDASYKSYLTMELAGKWLWTVHNYYLLRTAETGIPGGLAWILLLVMGVFQSLKLTRSSKMTFKTLGLGCSAGIIAVSHQMYWDMWTHVTAQGLFWFLLGLLGAAEAIERKMQQRERLVVPHQKPRYAPPGAAGAFYSPSR